MRTLDYHLYFFSAYFFFSWVCHTQVAELATVKSVAVRVELLNDWFTNGGVMIMGYEVFRILTHTDSSKYSKHKESFCSILLDPGKFF